MTLTMMHSSIARAGVQWNIPVESYLKNASDLLVYFSPWNDVNDNDDGYNFEIQLFLIQMTVQTFLNSIHDWYSDQSNVLEKKIFKSDELTSWLFARNQCRPGHSQFFPSSRLSTENVITFRNHTLTLLS